MSAETGEQSKSPNLESVLQSWVATHNGRLWQTPEETKALTEETGFTKLQVKNWFAPRRKSAKVALERGLLEKPTEFMSRYSVHETKTLRQFFATIAEHGYLPETGKSLIARSTGLSTRSVVDFFDKFRRDPRFITLITNMQSSTTQSDATQPINIPALLSPTLPAFIPTPPQQAERVTNLGAPIPVISATLPIIPQQSKKRKRNSACLQNDHMFAWHRGRQVNLTTEVEPLLLNHPGVQSTTQLQQQLHCFAEPSVIPDLIFALERIPFKENGTVDFDILRTSTMQRFPQAAGEYGCPYCDNLYKEASLAAAHLHSHTGPFFICSVPNCRANVGEIPMTHRSIRYHMEEHEKRGDISNCLAPPLSRPSAKEHWQQTPQEIREYISQLLTQKASTNTTREDPPRIVNETESNKETNKWFRALKQQAIASVKDGMARATDISEQTQVQLLSYNLDQIEKGKFQYKSWATAKVKSNRGGLTLDFDIRCIECAKEFALYEFFQSYGVLSDDDDTETICSQSDCSHPRLYRALYCSVHILYKTVSSSKTKVDKQVHQNLVSQLVEATGVWELDECSNFEVFLNRQQLPNAPRFFALDLEGHISRKPPTVEQAAAVDIDSIHNECEQVLFNVNISNPAVPAAPESETQDFVGNLLNFGPRDYWQYNKETLSGERVSHMRAVAIIQESGITCQDFIVVWHKNYADLNALRYLLSQAGVHGVLPPDDHIIRLNYLFSHNLNLPKGVTCALEFLFSIIFPTHPLRFVHHDALIDSRKTALMALFAEKLCKS
ncbi:zinc finger protein 76 (expressed in testis) [Fusarium austroafricanum]|uniref:Zinc finger protein 76 (Expressed in testis) n=1 Tax=Fusarium austroafricanum TaxID=2364996 RepID=A0A8H4KEN8_9HYPO|nr:zinc finger protein 76 (expressed in testis) [Fusarium austroafricanum]